MLAITTDDTGELFSLILLNFERSLYIIKSFRLSEIITNDYICQLLN